ncbi:MAG: hypothetical protein QXK89_10125 [Candidatus Bathyarchaeia archaeon]
MLSELRERLKKERGEVEAKYGERMIELRVAFFTDNIANTEGKVVPKVCWDIGTVRLLANAAHGVKASEPYFFDGLSELLTTIEKLLVDNGIKVLHCPRRTRDLYY